MSTSQLHLEQYELQERLDSSANSEVWKAFDTQRHRSVAIKLFHVDPRTASDFVPRFLHEAQSIAALHHPNIAQVLDFQVASFPESTSTVAYIATEYVEGYTLAEYIHRTSSTGNIPSAADIVYLLTTIGGAIDYAHQQGIVHRSLSPSSIVLDIRRSNPHSTVSPPVITDFGTANIVGVADGPLNTLYASPEQVQGAPGDERSDLYALGVILYQMCTGAFPFQGDNLTAVMTQRIQDTPIAPALLRPGIPPALTMVLLRSLAKDPIARFATASSMATAVADALNIAPLELSTMNAPTYLTPRNEDHAKAAKASNLSASLPQPSIAPPAPRRRGRGLLIALIVALLIVLIGGGLGTFYLLPRKNADAAPSIVGHAFFISSGQVSAHTIQGINDELFVDLHNLHSPAPGKNYYAWLLPDKNNSEAASIPLGTLTVAQGNVRLIYKDEQHTNLLATTSRFLITEEDAGIAPVGPSLDVSTWRYFAELPQVPVLNAEGQRFSLLDHLRHLLAADPKLDQLSLLGGLTLWLNSNVERTFEFAESARDDWQPKQVGLMRSQLTRILDYLDSNVYVQTDLPPGMSAPNDPKARVALLEIDQQRQDPPGYLVHISRHLQGLLASPGINDAQRKLVTQINRELNNVTSWLKQVHQYASQLIQMNDAQLLLPSSLNLLDALATYALYAYLGRLSSATNLFQGGTVQINYDTQSLATFEISLYHTNGR